MGLNDRDYMRNRGTGPEKRRVASSSIRLPVYFIIILISIGSVIGITKRMKMKNYNRIAATQQTVTVVTRNYSLQTSSCNALPENGYGFILDPSVMRRTDVLYSGIEFINQHDYSMVMLITSPDGVSRHQAVAVHPHESVNLSVPVAQYGLTVLVGRSWCNVEKGFTDGNRVRIEGTFSISNSETTSIVFRSEGVNAKDFSVSYSSKPLKAANDAKSFEINGNGSISLKQTKNGHYILI
ncbi:MAG: hypothetical protein IT392_02090 [Nitrospirae bacterium]|nr:hypothetical protein [Nitrospirota bacterium]